MGCCVQTNKQLQKEEGLPISKDALKVKEDEQLKEDVDPILEKKVDEVKPTKDEKQTDQINTEVKQIEDKQVDLSEDDDDDMDGMEEQPTADPNNRPYSTDYRNLIKVNEVHLQQKVDNKDVSQVKPNVDEVKQPDVNQKDVEKAAEPEKEKEVDVDVEIKEKVEVAVIEKKQDEVKEKQDEVKQKEDQDSVKVNDDKSEEKEPSVQNQEVIIQSDNIQQIVQQDNQIEKVEDKDEKDEKDNEKAKEEKDEQEVVKAKEELEIPNKEQVNLIDQNKEDTDSQIKEIPIEEEPLQKKGTDDQTNMDNSLIDAFLAILKETQKLTPENADVTGEWSNTVKPGKDGKQIWAWRKQCEQQTKIYLKIIHFYPGVKPETIYDCHDAEVRLSKWDKADSFKILEQNDKDQSQVIYQTMKKPPIPLVSQRDCVYKQVKRVNYMDSDIGTGHIVASQSVERDDCPPVKKLVRAIRDVTGYLIEPYEDGTKSTCILQMDMTGNLPSAALSAASKKNPVVLYDGIYPFAQEQEKGK